MSFFLICAAIGATMGLIAGLLGVGGGVIAVPAMIYFLKMDPKLAIGTSLVVIVPLALSGGLKKYSLGQVDLTVFLYLSLTGVVFSWLGAHWGHGLDPTLLKRGFAIFLLVVGARMLLEAPEPKPQMPLPATAPETLPKP